MTVRTCKQGHEQTPENQLKVNDSQRGIRYRCRPCANWGSRRKVHKGTPSIIEIQKARQKVRIEDIEFLLATGTPYQEIITRSGYSSEATVLRALKNLGRMDLHASFKNRTREKTVIHRRHSTGKTFVR